MARTRKSARRIGRINPSVAAEALDAALKQEFEDRVATATLPDPADRRGRERYAASMRRLALARPNVGIRRPDAAQGLSDPLPAFGQRVMDMASVAKKKLTIGALMPIKLGDGLYDFYPPELPFLNFFHAHPFAPPAFETRATNPANSSIAITVPQIGSGRFYASALSLTMANDRQATCWCGVMLPVDPNLHGDAQGPKDLVIWAEGTLDYDYALSAVPGAAWNTRPEAAMVTVDVNARLLRFDRRTGQVIVAADNFVGAYLAYRRLLHARLLPNATTTADPSKAAPSVGGPYAAWSSGPTPFTLGLHDGVTRLLDTDSLYSVAVVCSVGLSALAPQGTTPANAQVSAQLFLRLVTLGVLPHDPAVTF